MRPPLLCGAADVSAPRMMCVMYCIDSGKTGLGNCLDPRLASPCLKIAQLALASLVSMMQQMLKTIHRSSALGRVGPPPACANHL